jgi:uncharacterized protein YndB with AHSA1/START domain
MSTLTATTDVAAPIDQVFALLSNMERAPEWTPGLISVERTSAQESGVGVETRIVAQAGPKQSAGVGRCEAWDPPRLLTVRTAMDMGVETITTFRLEDVGGHTRIEAEMQLSIRRRGLGGLIGNVFGDAVARRSLDEASRRFKELVEREARSPKTPAKRRGTRSTKKAAD